MNGVVFCFCNGWRDGMRISIMLPLYYIPEFHGPRLAEFRTESMRGPDQRLAWHILAPVSADLPPSNTPASLASGYNYALRGFGIRVDRPPSWSVLQVMCLVSVSRSVLRIHYTYLLDERMQQSEMEVYMVTRRELGKKEKRKKKKEQSLRSYMQQHTKLLKEKPSSPTISD
jgi:hypothetical protein